MHAFCTPPSNVTEPSQIVKICLKWSLDQQRKQKKYFMSNDKSNFEQSAAKLYKLDSTPKQYRATYSYLYNDIHYSGTPVNRPDSLTLMAFCRQHCHTSLLSNALWCSNSWPHCTLPTLQSLFLFYTFTTSKYVHELFQNNTRVTQLRTFTNKYMQQLYDTCRGKEDLFVCFLHTSIKRDRTVTNSQNLLKVNTRSTEETKEILHVKIKLWAGSCKALKTGLNPKTI